MIKAIIFDADGVMVQSTYLSTRLLDKNEATKWRWNKDLDVSKEVLDKFFGGPFQDCLVGKSDLKIEVEKVKKDWNWGGSVDELLEYWFRDEANKVDERFEAVIGDLKKKGIVCGLGTNNEKHRTNDLVNNKGLGKWFAKHLHFSSSNVGHKKPEPEYFAKVTRLLGFAPEEIAFWDDDVKNVEAAKLHGWQANHYTDFDKFVDWSNKL